MSVPGFLVMYREGVMFSSRLEWGVRRNRIAQTLDELRRAGVPLLDLTESNPTRAGLQYPEAAILDLRSLVYEPSPAGLPAAREAVSAYYAGRGHRVEPDRLVLTASTSEAYAYLFKLLADPGAEVLVPRPSYPLFDFLAALESVHVVQYPLVYHGSWSIDFDALARAVTAQTRAIVVVNPNNPTGSFLKRDELEQLVALRLPILSDEVFSDYAYGDDARRVASLVDVESALVFSMSGLSKIAGMPQVKLGWIAVAGPAELRAQAIDRLELIADTYLSVGTPVQHAAARLLAAGESVRAQIARRTRANLECLRAAVERAPEFEVLTVEGGWYAVLRAPRVRSEEDWTLALLRDASVVVQPGFFFDFESEAYLVVSLLTPPDTFSEGIRRILALG